MIDISDVGFVKRIVVGSNNPADLQSEERVFQTTPATLIAICASCVFIFVPSAQAASFDCGKAKSKVEHIICDAPEISKLDDELSAAYKIALKNEKRADFIHEAQKQWLLDRDACIDAECVRQAYENQIGVLVAFDDKEPLLPLKPPAAKTKFGQYKMINDTFQVPQPDGTYTLENHAEVCTAFLKNLEASPPFPPMACDVKFRPEFKDFRTPEWRDVDVWENRDLELQIGTPPVNEAEKIRGLANIKDYIDAGMLVYRESRFDIDNDGVSDQIVARIHGKCVPEKKDASVPYWRNYQVYDASSRKLDIGKAQFYGSHWDTTSLFTYKGFTYYASLLGGVTNESYFGKLDRPDKSGVRPTKYYIRLYRPIPMSQGTKHPVALGCEYLYLPANNEGGY